MMIYLASQSPRRAELLQQIGVSFEKLWCEIDETPHDQESPEDYVLRMAHEKSGAGWEKVVVESLERRPLLAADTSVICDGEILGKPADEGEAISMLEKLSGRSHQVMTAVAITDGDRLLSERSVTEVTFNPLNSDLIREYVATGEPLDKAGAYGIQGFGAVLVSRIQGSYPTVVGLPLMETAGLLRSFKVPVWNR